MPTSVTFWWVLLILVVSQTTSNTELFEPQKYSSGSLGSVRLASYSIADEGLALCAIATKITTLQSSSIATQTTTQWLKDTSLKTYVAGTTPEWCLWTGVTCDGTTFTVTAIELPSKSLKAAGGLSKATLQSLSVLTNIKSLILSGNKFSQAIPTSIGFLTALTMLDLSAQTPGLSGG